jgi:hypothetical protein
MENNHTKLKTEDEHMDLERFHNPKERRQVEPLDLPTEQSKSIDNLIIQYS